MSPAWIKCLYTRRVVGGVFGGVVAVVLVVRLMVVVCGIVTSGGAVALWLEPVLLSWVAVGPRGNAVVRHVLEMRAPVGAVGLEIAPAAVLDDVVLVVEWVVTMKGLGGVAVGIVVVGGLYAIVGHRVMLY